MVPPIADATATTSVESSSAPVTMDDGNATTKAATTKTKAIDDDGGNKDDDVVDYDVKSDPSPHPTSPSRLPRQGRRRRRRRGSHFVEPSETSHGGTPPYVRCDATGDFEMPASDDDDFFDGSDHDDVDDEDGEWNNGNSNNDGGVGGYEGRTPAAATTTTALATQQRMQQRQRRRSGPPRRLSSSRSAEEVNETLNLNLGLKWLDPMNPTLRAICRAMASVLTKFEGKLFRFWCWLSLRLRQRLTMLGWTAYLPLHKLLLGKRTAIHPDASYEYHALTTALYWGRLFPVSIRQMRFSLSQIHVCHPPEAYPPLLPLEEDGGGDGGGGVEGGGRRSAAWHKKRRNGQRYGLVGHVTEVYHGFPTKKGGGAGGTKGKASKKGNRINDSDDHDDSSVVTGYYVQHGSTPSTKVLFWLYGGAFLAGDSKGNLGIAEKIGRRLLCDNGGGGDGEGRGGVDVFLPDYRLVPEFHLDDAIHDVSLAYEYLVTVRGIDPKNVIMLGISSGGGLVASLLQLIAERERSEEDGDDGDDDGGDVGDDPPLVKRTVGEGEEKGTRRRKGQKSIMPAGAVLMCPFVDYTEPKGSFKEYVVHDLVVNQSVFEEGIPYLEKVLGGPENRRKASPVYGNFQGLPPLCVIASEHESVYDQCVLLVNNARADGVDVVFGVWKYMCHVWPMFSAFIPEGRQAMDFMCHWIDDAFRSEDDARHFDTP